LLSIAQKAKSSISGQFLSSTLEVRGWRRGGGGASEARWLRTQRMIDIVAPEENSSHSKSRPRPGNNRCLFVVIYQIIIVDSFIHSFIFLEIMRPVVFWAILVIGIAHVISAKSFQNGKCTHSKNLLTSVSAIALYIFVLNTFANFEWPSKIAHRNFFFGRLKG
jgi:hypothetical protein